MQGLVPADVSNYQLCTFTNLKGTLVRDISMSRFVFVTSDINECASSPCQNGGQCRDTVNGFECENCAAGYEGELCDEGRY